MLIAEGNGNFAGAQCGNRMGRSGVVALVVGVSLAGILWTAVLNYGVVAFKAEYLCPPDWWVERTIGDLSDLVPPDVEHFVRVGDCDAARAVHVGFADARGNPTAIYRNVLRRASEQGWTQAEGEPWWGCWTKRIMLLDTWMRVRPDFDVGSYYIEGDISRGGQCNGG